MPRVKDDSKRLQVFWLKQPGAGVDINWELEGVIRTGLGKEEFIWGMKYLLDIHMEMSGRQYESKEEV